jgi:hypothetical protein
VRHGVPRVDDEVHQHLFELALVRAHEPEVRIVGKRERDLLPDQPVQEMRQIGKRIPKVEELGLQSLLAREGQELAHEARRAIGVLVDLLEIGVIRMSGIALQKK